MIVAIVYGCKLSVNKFCFVVGKALMLCLSDFYVMSVVSNVILKKKTFDFVL